MVENIDNYGFYMSYQNCYMLFNIYKQYGQPDFKQKIMQEKRKSSL